MARFEQFAVWRAADQLAVSVYRATERFPKHELYGITSQARRAAVSVAANLAEGLARWGSRELAHFVSISRGSLAELRYLLRLSQDLGYLDPLTWNKMDTLVN